MAARSTSAAVAAGAVAAETRDFDFRALADVWYRRRWMVLSLLVLTMAATEAALWVVYPVYEAKAKILIGAQTGFEIPFSRENIAFKKAEITQTQAELLTSRPNLTEVVTMLKLHERPKYPEGLRARVHEFKDDVVQAVRNAVQDAKRMVIVNVFGGKYAPPRTPDPMEQAIEKLERGGALRVEPVTNTDVLELTVRDREPEWAAKIANTITEVFLREELDSRRQRARAIHDSIEQRLLTVRPELEHAREAVAVFKDQHGLTDIQKEMDAAFATLSMLETTYWDVSQKESVRAITGWEALQRTLSARRDLDLRGRTALMQRLAELAQLETVYAPDHPRVVAARAGVAQLRSELGADDPAPPGTGPESQPSMDTEATRAALAKKISELHDELLGLSRLDNQYQALRWEQEDKADLIKFLARKREDALTAEYTTQAQARVIAPASIPEQPNWPRKWLFRGLALLTALALSVGLCVLFERFDDTIRTPEAAARLVGLRTLGSIPYVTR